MDEGFLKIVEYLGYYSKISEEDTINLMTAPLLL